ncbi:MAG: T9SS type A sorting domain-containing protein, partial [Bacteroidia bacterium]
SWLAFTGKVVNEQKNELNWQTSQEMNADYFELEFGSDPNNFVPVGKIKAAGNSNTIQQYTMAHAHQEQGVNTFYYRVKQVDTDGKYSYSKTITLSNEITQVNKPEISVINPFSGAIKFGLNQTDFSEISIRVLDNQGRVVYANSREANAGFSMHELPETATLANGLYYIEISQLGAPILLQKLIKVTE